MIAFILVITSCSYKPIFSEKNYKTYGFDIDESKIKQLNDCETYIKHISSDQIKASIEEGFVPTSDFSKISEMDAILICVPTPLSKHREPDLSYDLRTFEQSIPYIKKGQIISLESTTFPGTTDEIVKPMIEKKNFKKVTSGSNHRKDYKLSKKRKFVKNNNNSSYKPRKRRVYK